MLIIIDMQYEFDAAEDVVGPVCDAVRQAKNEGRQIVLVEYKCWNHFPNAETCGCRTYYEITSLLEGYTNLVVVTKANDGGGREIIDAVSVFPSDVDVCGVNIGACVRETVEQLSRLVPDSEFTLLEQACNGWDNGPSAYYWVENLRNVDRRAA